MCSHHYYHSCIFICLLSILTSSILSIYLGAESGATTQQEQVAGAAAEQISGPGQGSGLRLRQGEEEGQGQGQRARA